MSSIYMGIILIAAIENASLYVIFYTKDANNILRFVK
jgi:hypothetical protein